MSIINKKPTQKYEFDYDATENQLAVATADAMAPYISHQHWGINKRHRITKSEWVACTQYYELKKQGINKPKVVIRNADGSAWHNYRTGKLTHYNPFINYKSKLWGADKINPCINGDELHYYMSPARVGRKMAYFDLDAHDSYQDDLDDAVQLLKNLFGNVLYYRPSHRGYNGWLKFNYAPTAKDYNAVLAHTEQVLRAVFAQENIKTSIEVKGRAIWGRIEQWTDRRSHLAKLPYWNHSSPCNKKSPDDCWNFDRLEAFKTINDAVFASFESGIETLKQKLKPSTIMASKKSSDTSTEVLQADACTLTAEPSDVCFEPTAIGSLEDIRNIPNAFVKNRTFTFWCNTNAGRPHTAEELLELDRQNNIYNGDWEDGLQERIKRYNDIAPFAARGFDPDKCGKPSQRPILDAALEKWRSKQHKFCKTSIGYCGNQVVKVDRSVLVGLASIIQTASKPNRDCSRDSIQGWWEEMAIEGIMPDWSVYTYTAARSVLHRSGVIGIDHDRYQYVPDGRGRCKGIWIKEDALVGEQHYCYPPQQCVNYFALHKGYVIKITEIITPIDDYEANKPPP